MNKQTNEPKRRSKSLPIAKQTETLRGIPFDSGRNNKTIKSNSTNCALHGNNPEDPAEDELLDCKIRESDDEKKLHRVLRKTSDSNALHRIIGIDN